MSQTALDTDPFRKLFSLVIGCQTYPFFTTFKIGRKISKNNKNIALLHKDLFANNKYFGFIGTLKTQTVLLLNCVSEFRATFLTDVSKSLTDRK